MSVAVGSQREFILHAGGLGVSAPPDTAFSGSAFIELSLCISPRSVPPDTACSGSAFLVCVHLTAGLLVDEWETVWSSSVLLFPLCVCVQVCRHPCLAMGGRVLQRHPAFNIQRDRVLHGSASLAMGEKARQLCSAFVVLFCAHVFVSLVGLGGTMGERGRVSAATHVCVVVECAGFNGRENSNTHRIITMSVEHCTPLINCTQPQAFALAKSWDDKERVDGRENSKTHRLITMSVEHFASLINCMALME